MFKDIRCLIYEKKLSLNSTEYFELDINEDGNMLKYIDNINKIEIIDDELVIEYFDNLFRIIDEWKHKYEDNSMIDGIGWQLQIIYKNGKIKQYSGKNDFPINFEYIDNIKNKMINKIIGE